MSSRSWLVSLVLLALLAPAGPSRAAGVAVLMSADVGAYQDALRGFRETLRHPVVAEYDMRGDFDRGRRLLAEIVSQVKPDLILAVGLWALQVVVREDVRLPVTFTMVLNPPSIIRHGGQNITGASMNVPVEGSIDLLERLAPSIRRIGVIFDQSKTGYLVARAEAVARERDLKIVARAVGSPKEAIQAINALQETGIDALWILPDETVLDPKVLQYALLYSYRNRVPLLGLSKRQAEMGALMSLSFGSSEDIGRQAGELANDILNGRRPAELPYTTARDLKLTVNLKAARKLGVSVPESILAQADTVIQ